MTSASKIIQDFDVDTKYVKNFEGFPFSHNFLYRSSKYDPYT